MPRLPALSKTLTSHVLGQGLVNALKAASLAAITDINYAIMRRLRHPRDHDGHCGQLTALSPAGSLISRTGTRAFILLATGQAITKPQLSCFHSRDKESQRAQEDLSTSPSHLPLCAHPLENIFGSSGTKGQSYSRQHPVGRKQENLCSPQGPTRLAWFTQHWQNGDVTPGHGMGLRCPNCGSLTSPDPGGEKADATHLKNHHLL